MMKAIATMDNYRAVHFDFVYVVIDKMNCIALNGCFKVVVSSRIYQTLTKLSSSRVCIQCWQNLQYVYPIQNDRLQNSFFFGCLRRRSKQFKLQILLYIDYTHTQTNVESGHKSKN